MCSDGRHYRPAIGRIAKLQRVAEMRVDLSRSRHRGERRPPLDIGIMKQGLVRWAPVGERSAKRPHVMCVSRDRVAWKSGFAMRLFARSEEHTSELQSLMRISYAVFCLKK